VWPWIQRAGPYFLISHSSSEANAASNADHDELPTNSSHCINECGEGAWCVIPIVGLTYGLRRKSAACLTVQPNGSTSPKIQYLQLYRIERTNFAAQ